MDLKIAKVLISDKVDASCKAILDKHGMSVDYKPGLSPEELKNIISEYDALIVRSATKVTADVIECGKKLKLVGRAGTGVDNIDQPAASKNGVLVMNTPGGNTFSAAEHTCAMISALARNIGQAHASMQEGKWERSKFMGCELLGKTLAIVGLGKIGREVALRMQSYGMKTIGYDPLVSAEEAATFNVDYMVLEKLWPLADFITVHVPLIPPTKGMINAKVFAICKTGVKVINVARGGIIDEKDLLEALNDGRCGGAGLDVFVTEPPKDVSFDLVKHPKVLATPHLGASTTEAQLRVAQEIAEQIVDATNGKPMVGLVNAPALAELANPEYKPWIEAAEKLGKLFASFNKDIEKVSIITHGNCLSSATRLLSASFSCGIAKIMDPSANIINSVSILKDKSIQVTSSHVKCDVAQISVKINDSISLAATVSIGKPVLLSVFGVGLTSPVALSENIIVGYSTQLSSRALIKLLHDVDITSVSTGLNGSTSVLVASVEGHADEALQQPLKYIEL